MARRSKEVNRVVILEAATELIAKSGYNQVSMDEIATKSAITKRTLYKYFPSKASILFSIFESYLQKIYDMSTLRAARNLPVAEHLKENLRELFEFSMRNYSFMKLFWTLDVREVNGEDLPILKDHIKMWNMNISRVSAAVIRRTGLTGWLANFTPEEVVEMISAINKGLVIQMSKDKNLDMSKVEAERFLGLFVGLLDLALRDGIDMPEELLSFLPVRS